MQTKLKDLTGERFGRLVVIKRHGSTNGKRKLPTWLCQCDCGNTAIRTGKALKSSKNSGCDECKRIRQDLTGKQFGRLKVISRYGSRNGEVIWNCKCQCGRVAKVSTGKLNFGSVISCGCARSEKTTQRNETHGMSNTRLYEIWSGMKKRCYNRNSSAYKNYGGRGIKICDEWKNSFENFYDWSLINGYKEDLTIERKDVNGDYCPENCCWITAQDQARNTRKTIYYTLFNMRKPLSEWCNYANIKNNRAYQRYKNGNCPFDEKELENIKLNLNKGGN